MQLGIELNPQFPNNIYFLNFLTSYLNESFNFHLLFKKLKIIVSLTADKEMYLIKNNPIFITGKKG